MKEKPLGLCPKPQKLLKKFHQNFILKSCERTILNVKVFAPLFSNGTGRKSGRPEGAVFREAKHSESGWEFEGKALKVLFMRLSCPIQRFVELQ
jgi:hypothetical protein